MSDRPVHRISGESLFQADNATILGHGNYIRGSDLDVRGHNNMVIGARNKLFGNSNAAIGNDCMVVGNWARLHGNRGVISGRFGEVQGKNNRLLEPVAGDLLANESVQEERIDETVPVVPQMIPYSHEIVTVDRASSTGLVVSGIRGGGEHTTNKKETPKRPEPREDEPWEEGKVQCVVCYERVACYMCVPCNHFCLCNCCALALPNAECPKCRARIAEFQRVYV